MSRRVAGFGLVVGWMKYLRVETEEVSEHKLLEHAMLFAVIGHGHHGLVPAQDS